MIKEVSAGIVLFRRLGSKLVFLLLNYPSGHGDFVKGKMETSETPQQTAIRETKEETGITDIQFIHDFKERIEYNFQFENELVHKQVIFFLAETNTENIVLSHEHLDYSWLEFNDAVKKTTYDNAKTVLTKAYNLLSNTL